MVHLLRFVAKKLISFQPESASYEYIHQYPESVTVPRLDSTLLLSCIITNIHYTKYETPEPVL